MRFRATMRLVTRHVLHALRATASLAFASAVVRLLATPAARIGDGSEYYALFFAWRDAGRPWMTDATWRAYDALRLTGHVAGLVPAAPLREAFGTLDVHGGTDVHHFWFYSGLAATVGRALHVDSAHTSFLVLAALLLAVLFAAAWRSFGARGLVAAAALLCLSPAVWFVDKVHTEHFTFCATTCAVIFFMRRRYSASCLALAVASTQNPSFAIVAVVVAAIAATSARRGQWKKHDVALYALATLVAALHPAYYLLRYGSISPQLYTGGARLFASARFAWVWFFDLDIGLFPAWPLGVVLGALALASFRWRARWIVFVVAWVGASLAAQSSTLNLNSGGTFGMARYGIWYLALFFPVVLALVERARRRPRVVVALAGLAAIHAFVFFRPSLDEGGYSRPTPISYAVQRWAPWAYDPPIEIFAERYSGVGESYAELAGAVAIAGPDCHKVLVLRGGTGRVLGRCNLAVADLVAAHAIPVGPLPLARFAALPSAEPAPAAHLVLHVR